MEGSARSGASTTGSEPLCDCFSSHTRVITCTRVLMQLYACVIVCARVRARACFT